MQNNEQARFLLIPGYRALSTSSAGLYKAKAQNMYRHWHLTVKPSPFNDLPSDICVKLISATADNAPDMHIQLCTWVFGKCRLNVNNSQGRVRVATHATQKKLCHLLQLCERLELRARSIGLIYTALHTTADPISQARALVVQVHAAFCAGERGEVTSALRGDDVVHVSQTGKNNKVTSELRCNDHMTTHNTKHRWRTVHWVVILSQYNARRRDCYKAGNGYFGSEVNHFVGD